MNFLLTCDLFRYFNCNDKLSNIFVYNIFSIYKFGGLIYIMFRIGIKYYGEVVYINGRKGIVVILSGLRD